MTTPQALAASPKTFLDRDNWMRAVLASTLPDKAVRLAIRIALHLRVDSGKCNPSFKKLAEETSIGERSTYRLVDLLEHTGWLAVTRLSGLVNQYTLLTTATQMAGVDHCHPDGRGTTAKSTTPPLPNRGGTTANRVADKKRRTTKRTTKGKRDSLPAVAARGSEEDSRRKKKPSRHVAGNLSGAEFDRFWAIYPKHDAQERARRAFAKAIEDTDPEVIIAGAQRYAAAEQARMGRPGQTAQHTAFAVNWLGDRRWKDPPPAGPVIDQDGNEIAPQQQPRQPRYSGFVAVAEQIIASGVVLCGEDRE